jgi:hypothetical protein
MIPAEALLVVVRYLVVLGCGALASHGVVQSAIPAEVSNAASQIIVALLTAGGMVSWGLWRDRQKYYGAIRDLVRRHRVTIHAEPGTAATLQAQGVPNVVASPPAPQ